MSVENILELSFPLLLETDDFGMDVNIDHQSGLALILNIINYVFGLLYQRIQSLQRD